VRWRFQAAFIHATDFFPPADRVYGVNQKGPHWTDLLKAWVGAPVRRGKPQNALVKSDEALKYAPDCKKLKETREPAAKLKI
jgi:hypothetical protein